MVKETVLKQLRCPICKRRICDKEEGAAGLVHQKCIGCGKVWRIDLATNQFKLKR